MLALVAIAKALLGKPAAEPVAALVARSLSNG